MTAQNNIIIAHSNPSNPKLLASNLPMPSTHEPAVHTPQYTHAHTYWIDLFSVHKKNTKIAHDNSYNKTVLASDLSTPCTQENDSMHIYNYTNHHLNTPTILTPKPKTYKTSIARTTIETNASKKKEWQSMSQSG